MRPIDTSVCVFRQHTIPSCVIFVVIGLHLLTPPATNAQDTFDLASASRAADTIRGPVTIRLINVNRLRYNIQIARTATAVPLDLRPPTWLAGFPSSASQVSFTTPSGDQDIPSHLELFSGILSAAIALPFDLRQLELPRTPVPMPEDTAIVNAVRDFHEARDSAEQQIQLASTTLMRVQEQVRTLVTTSNASIDSLTTLLLASDHVLERVGANGLLPRMADVRTALGDIFQELSILRDGVDTLRMSIQQGRLSLRGLRSILNDAPAIGQYLHDDVVDALVGYLDEVERGAVAIDDHQLELKGSLQVARDWHYLLESLLGRGEKAFVHIESVKCNSPFPGGAYVTLKVSQTDRGTPQVASSQGADTVTESRTIVAVKCPPRFHVSAGWLATRVDLVEYGTMAVPEEAVNGDPAVATVNRVILVEESESKQSPILMVTGRLWNWSLWGAPLGLHLAVGTLIDFGGKDQSEDVVKLLGGSLGSEFVVGGSVSLADMLFVSPVVHFVETSTLSPEIQLGMPLPAGISEVPLVKHVKSRFALAATLRFPLG